MLSLCLIARDEHDLLADCLESVWGIVDEMVVADTGSCDDTVAIAKAAGAVVVHHSWQDDFAAARNSALLMARGDWILVLDADERLAPGAGDAILAAIRRNDLDLGLLPLHNATHLDATPQQVLSGEARRGEAVWLPRLFRKSPTLRWEGVVHEMPRTWLESRPRTRRIEAPIVHLGNVPSVREEKDKAARNLRLLEKRCLQEPDRSSAWAYLASERIHSGDVPGAREAVERGWTALHKELRGNGLRPTFVSLTTLRAHLQMKAGAFQDALDTVAWAERQGANHPNMPFLRATALEQMGHLEEAMAAYDDARRFDGAPAEEVLPGAMTWASLTRQAELALALDRPSRRSWQDVLNLGRDTLEIRLGLAEAMVREGFLKEGIAAVEGQLARDTPDGWCIAALACSELGRPQEVSAFSRRAMSASLKQGFIAPRRRKLLEELREEARLYEGRLVPGDTVAGRLAALIKRVPLRVGAVPPQRGVTLALNLVRIGRGELLEPLLEPRANDLFEGFHDALIDGLERFGGSIDDDGEPDFVFIGGAGRSGTTLFRTMLSAHRRFWCGPELKLVSAICGLRDQWMGTMGPDLREAGVTDRVLDQAVRAFVQSLLQDTAQGERVAEKTPHNLLHMATLGRMFPRARFVHVVRDGRAVSASLVRQGWRDPATNRPVWYCEDLEQASRYWAQVVASVRAQARSVPGRYLEVRYEDLVQDPETAMRTVLAFLGERWDPAVLAHETADVKHSARESSTAAVQSAVNTDAVDRWRSEFSEDALRQLDASALVLLTELGYAA